MPMNHHEPPNASPDGREDNRFTPRRSPHVVATTLLVVGALLLALGVVVMITTWPERPMYWGVDLELEESDRDSRALPALGAVTGAVGLIILVVPLIAWGTRLGHAMTKR